MSKNEHWYAPDGTSAHEQPNKSKPGTMRPTTLTDAKKLKLLPSVTTVLGILDKPQLADWKARQITEAAFFNEARKSEGETQEEYHKRIIESAFQQVDDAADLGTRIHKAIEQDNNDEPFEEEMRPYVEGVRRWLVDNKVDIIESELRLVSLKHGYAGTTDGVFTSPKGTGILDFKSRKTEPGKPVKNWEDQPTQIAAYLQAKREGFGKIMPHIGVNVFISTTEPGRVEACWYDEAQLDKEWEVFQACLTIWRHRKGYDPRVRE